MSFEFSQAVSSPPVFFSSFEPGGKGAGGVQKGFAPCRFSDRLRRFPEFGVGLPALE
jgi:hypothetical protein